MQFLSFNQIREREQASGHDLLFGSLLNLAGGPGVEDGECIYMGQDPEGRRAMLFVDIHAAGTLVDQSGFTIAGPAQLDDLWPELKKFSWLYPY